MSLSSVALQTFQLRAHIFQGRFDPGMDASGLLDPIVRVTFHGYTASTRVSFVSIIHPRFLRWRANSSRYYYRGDFRGSIPRRFPVIRKWISTEFAGNLFHEQRFRFLSIFYLERPFKYFKDWHFSNFEL